MKNKLIDENGLKHLRHRITGNRQDRRWTLVATNGCFDIIHRGHVEYLAQAKKMGSLLLVGLNGDDSVRELKGDSRPVNCQEDRAAVLSAFEFVDYVYIFEEKRATDFLKLASPDIYVKAGDYDIDSIHEPERCMLNLCGAEIKFLPFIEGKSTTATLNKLNNGNK